MSFPRGFIKQTMDIANSALIQILAKAKRTEMFIQKQTFVTTGLVF